MESANGAHARTNARERLSTTLPPLIFGTATFNYQFSVDPYALHPTHIVHAALHQGIRAFDTSPYYGPAETILGDALTDSLITTDPVLKNLKRSDYFILTKAGRIAADEFDYSAEWIRYSVQRSCKRLHTTYLDVVYLHDVEFVSPEEVLTGIRELRNLRPEGMVRYVGICGYPVDVLCELAEMVLKETGEPLDIVQSYANSTVQNQQLQTRGLERLINAGVDVVPNASPLGMGLCRAQGPPIGAMGNWHPAPDELKERCARAAEWVQTVHGEKLETIAVRFAMENWANVGQAVGSCGILPSDAVRKLKGENVDEKENARIGVNVMGVSKITELEETMTVYNSIIKAKDDLTDDRRQQICGMVSHIRENILGSEWTDYAWESPEPGFKNARKECGVPAAQKEELNLKEAENLERDQAQSDSVGDLKGTTHVEVKEVVLPAAT